MSETLKYLSVGSDNIATIVAWQGEPEKSAFVYGTVRPEHVTSLAHDDVAPVIERRVNEVKADADLRWPVANITVQLGAYNPFNHCAAP
jgi:hypothetical protein